ncbi:MAG: redoxin domain-containing protein, partial [Acidiferrobacteraceae bacterium]|nr:redoxin domain-containing protein [Acidiferrobacteraceae bacterium]
MVSTASTMGSLGSPAPAFSLPNTNPAAGEKTVSLSDYASNSALLVAFICNHCPYVIHIREALV